MLEKYKADAQVQECEGTEHPAPSVGNPNSCLDVVAADTIGSAHGVPGSDASTEAKHKNRGSGAPPSNTAPANYINTDKTKILRFGVDSLYLSYPGQISSEWDQRLTGLKLAAQSEDDTDKAKAQVKIGEHLFEVKGKGGQRFSFVLVDNCFHIQLSGYNTTALPLAYVQLSSELLTTLSVQEAVNTLSTLIRSFGLVKGEPNQPG
ncbi:MAG: hypothetical protein WAW61_15305 [Methylococcaceae bacterium]